MAQSQTHKPHPWLDPALDFGRLHNSFCEIKFGSPEWAAWRDYFHWLNWAPIAFRECDESRSWTAPTRWPNDFTPQFKPAPIAIARAEQLFVDRQPGYCANFYVATTFPAYQAMCARAEGADPKDWRWYHDHPQFGSGIKVPWDWVCDWRGARRRRRDPDLDERYEAKQRGHSNESK
jgi:hypothetical protein